MAKEKVGSDVEQEGDQIVSNGNNAKNNKNGTLSLVPLQKELQQYMEYQLTMPWTEQRQLLTSQKAINESGVKKVVAMAKAYKLPLDVFALIPTKQGMKPYVLAKGIVFRLQMDFRGIESIIPEILHWATVEEPWAKVKCTIRFKDGSEFVKHASHSADSEGNPNWTPDFITMKCETKAVRRCGELAVGIPFPVYEAAMEWNAWETKQAVVEGEFKVLGEVNNFAEFLSNLMLDYNIQPMELPERLGIESMDQVEAHVYKTLKIESWGQIEKLDEAVVALGLKDGGE